MPYHSPSPTKRAPGNPPQKKVKAFIGGFFYAIIRKYQTMKGEQAMAKDKDKGKEKTNKPKLSIKDKKKKKKEKLEKKSLGI